MKTKAERNRIATAIADQVEWMLSKTDIKAAYRAKYGDEETDMGPKWLAILNADYMRLWDLISEGTGGDVK